MENISLEDGPAVLRAKMKAGVGCGLGKRLE